MNWCYRNRAFLVYWVGVGEMALVFLFGAVFNLSSWWLFLFLVGVALLWLSFSFEPYSGRHRVGRKKYAVVTVTHDNFMAKLYGRKEISSRQWTRWGARSWAKNMEQARLKHGFSRWHYEAMYIPTGKKL